MTFWAGYPLNRVKCTDTHYPHAPVEDEKPEIFFIGVTNNGRDPDPAVGSGFTPA